MINVQWLAGKTGIVIGIGRVTYDLSGRDEGDCAMLKPGEKTQKGGARRHRGRSMHGDGRQELRLTASAPEGVEKVLGTQWLVSLTVTM